jgi:hypothetical protein
VTTALSRRRNAFTAARKRKCPGEIIEIVQYSRRHAKAWSQKINIVLTCQGLFGYYVDGFIFARLITGKGH